VSAAGCGNAHEEVNIVDRSEGSPDEGSELWAEALWGAGLLGSVLLVVALVSLVFR